MMKWRIAERKLQFTNKLRTKDANNIAKGTLENEVILGLKGLKSECSQIAKEVGIPDVHWTGRIGGENQEGRGQMSGRLQNKK